MASPPPVPEFKSFSATMRVDALVSDWRAEVAPELKTEEKERALYERIWEAYLEGDYGFGLWCWHECDRLTNALGGSIREATRVVGAGRYLGFSHRKAIALKVPLELVYRPRKGDMSTPRPEALVLPHYQVLCVYAVRAEGDDKKAKAQLEIALGELEDRRRADPYLKHFETFRQLLERQRAKTSATTAA
ncbi:MAG TPA: hypothetical protein VGV89_09785 [Thermoplasmata archaeon]|nr:hypothetical protein [Thermoplasmata archaeon]